MLEELKTYLPEVIDCSRNDTRVKDRHLLKEREYELLRRLDALDEVPWPLKRPQLRSAEHPENGYSKVFATRVRLRQLPATPRHGGPGVYLTCHTQRQQPQPKPDVVVKAEVAVVVAMPDDHANAKVPVLVPTDRSTIDQGTNLVEYENVVYLQEKTMRKVRIEGAVGTSDNHAHLDYLLPAVTSSDEELDTPVPAVTSPNAEVAAARSNICSNRGEKRRLTTLALSDEMAVEDPGTVWVITVFGSDIVTIQNDNARLRYRTIAMNTDLFVSNSTLLLTHS